MKNVIEKGAHNGSVMTGHSDPVALHFNMHRDLFGLEIALKDRYFMKEMSFYTSSQPYYIKFNILTQIHNSYIETQF
jgi:hypothetical protein